MISKKNLSDYFEIVRGVHKDPFSILGIHIEEAADSKVAVIRAFRPDATSVSVVDLAQNKEFPMTMIHETGFFELLLPSRQEVFPYELKVQREDGSTIQFRDPYSFLPVTTEFDRHLFNEGKNYRAFEKFGSHVMEVEGVEGVYFCVWAPNAVRVSVVGEFNFWDGSIHYMRLLGESGIWEIFVPGLGANTLYKYEIMTRDNMLVHKADPYGTMMQLPPETASVVHPLDGFEWTDTEWMNKREVEDQINGPMAIYEVHLGSWLRGDGNEILSFRDIAPKLVQYCKDMGYTHLELLPLSEHPFYGSWGYQVIGYFATTSRYGTPQDFMYFVNLCHENGIAVLLDWVPAHFPKDIHGLGRFDGTPLYEHGDPRMGEQLDWGTLVYDYGKTEVRGFLISNLVFWCEKFHIDGFRMDAVASMLYLDYSRNEWIPNKYGGRENLDAVEFLKEANDVVHKNYPGVVMIAEESTSWPGVCRATHLGGLGFDFKWNLGWMNDILSFFATDPLYRKFEMGKLTFAIYYAFSENFILVLSHDEVVHGKYSLLNKMPGDLVTRFANLRLLMGYLYAHPGKKLTFMGGDIAQQIEWNHDQGLDWHLLRYPAHESYNLFIQDMLSLYNENESMWRIDFESDGFDWIDFHDAENTIVSFMRKTKNPADTLIFVFNFTPVTRHGYRIGVPFAGEYKEIMNSDSQYYGGTNVGNNGTLYAHENWYQNQPFSMEINLPPLGMLVFRPLEAPKMVESGVEKKLLKVYTMPAGIEKPSPETKSKKKSGTTRKSKPEKKVSAKSAKLDKKAEKTKRKDSSGSTKTGSKTKKSPGKKK